MTTNGPVKEEDQTPSSQVHLQHDKYTASEQQYRSRDASPENLPKQASPIQDGLARNPPLNEDPPSLSTRVVHENHDEVSSSARVHPVEGVSQWSHQILAPKKVDEEDTGHEDDWQEMPAYAPYDIYDDDNKLIAREARELDEDNAYKGLGGAGKGYTRVQVDEDARSTTSMDDNTSYLFQHRSTGLADEDEEHRDPLAQMQATKNLLTEGQRIAYVGLTRLAMSNMVKDLDGMEGTKSTKKDLRIASESIKMWSQQMIVRLYAHMEIDSSGTIDRTSSL